MNSADARAEGLRTQSALRDIWACWSLRYWSFALSAINPGKARFVIEEQLNLEAPTTRRAPGLWADKHGPEVAPDPSIPAGLVRQVWIKASPLAHLGQEVLLAQGEQHVCPPHICYATYWTAHAGALLSCIYWEANLPGHTRQIHTAPPAIKQDLCNPNVSDASPYY